MLRQWHQVSECKFGNSEVLVFCRFPLRPPVNMVMGPVNNLRNDFICGSTSSWFPVYFITLTFRWGGQGILITAVSIGVIQKPSVSSTRALTSRCRHVSRRRSRAVTCPLLVVFLHCTPSLAESGSLQVSWVGRCPISSLSRWLVTVASNCWIPWTAFSNVLATSSCFSAAVSSVPSSWNLHFRPVGGAWQLPQFVHEYWRDMLSQPMVKFLIIKNQSLASTTGRWAVECGSVWLDGKD